MRDGSDTVDLGAPARFLRSLFRLYDEAEPAAILLCLPANALIMSTTAATAAAGWQFWIDVPDMPEALHCIDTAWRRPRAMCRPA